MRVSHQEKSLIWWFMPIIPAEDHLPHSSGWAGQAGVQSSTFPLVKNKIEKKKELGEFPQWFVSVQLHPQKAEIASKNNIKGIQDPYNIIHII